MAVKLAGASVLAALWDSLLFVAPAGAEPALFESRQLTPAGNIQAASKGPASTQRGTLYCREFGRQGTMENLRRARDAVVELFATASRRQHWQRHFRLIGKGRMLIADVRQAKRASGHI